MLKKIDNTLKNIDEKAYTIFAISIAVIAVIIVEIMGRLGKKYD